MKFKTFGYIAFTALCVGGSAALLLNPPRSTLSFDDPWPGRGSITLAATTPQPAAAPAAQPAQPAPLPLVVAPAFADSPAAALLADRLNPPRRLDELLAPELAEHRDRAGKAYDASARPVVTPMTVRTVPSVPKIKQPLPPLKIRTDAPPLAMVDPIRPAPPTFRVLPRYAVQDVEPLLPPLRVPLVVRPRPEAVVVRDQGILNIQGNDQLHILPVMRNTPAFLTDFRRIPCRAKSS